MAKQLLTSKTLLAFAAVVVVWGTLAAETPHQTVSSIRAYPVEDKLTIDGNLSEDVWAQPASVDDVFITYNPTDGERLPKKTRVWLAYDPDNLYFAFYCHDSEPGKIKTSITRRDNMWGDDWVGVAFDPLGTRKCLYELFVNPSGMQGDIYNTPTTGENSGPDWVWYSGGQIVEDGYTVEIQMPLKNIRFRHGENVSLNVLFWRRINRLGMSGAWPMIDPGKGLYNSTAEVLYGQLKKQLKLEFIPTVTYGSLWDRQSPEDWSDADGKADIGITASYGITSSTTLDLTVNPDFSQVESDAFQVLRNRRYPIFYSEKRPFFMEAGDLFDLAGGHGNLWTAVHTRRIVDPIAGLRLTGDAGNLSFALLGAADRWPGRELENGENLYLGRSAYYGVGRLKYGLGGDNYLGMLYTGKELGDFYNRVFALDSSFRLGKAHALKGNAIVTYTGDPEADDTYSGGAVNAQYSYSTQSFYGGIGIESYSQNFQMDTAFYNRVGFTRAVMQLVPKFTVTSESLAWFKGVKPVVVAKYLHDTGTGMDDRYLNIGIILDFIKNASLTLAWDIVDDESWEGTTYDTSGFWGGGSIQLTNWLNLHTCFNAVNHIYYDDEDPFLGRLFRIHSAITLQPIDTLSLRFSYEYSNFDRKSTGEDVYDYHILFSRATFQPNRHLQFRLLVQYDSYLDLVLTDALASYELVPGTVVHIGYGSLYERLYWDPRDRTWMDDHLQRQLYNTSQTFFVKFSYRLQF